MPDIPAGYALGPAREDELAALPAIEAAAAARFPPELLAPELREDATEPAWFEAAAAAGRLWVVRTLTPPAPVGFAAATLLDGAAHLHEMDVLPDHGRRGLGRALLHCVAEWARSQGHARITLTTFREVPWNAPFYASLGFSEIPPDAVGPQLRRQLQREADAGLDPRRRVAMRLALHSG